MMLHRTRRNCTVRPYLFLGRDVLKDIIPNNSKGQLVKHQLRLTATKPIYNFFYYKHTYEKQNRDVI